MVAQPENTPNDGDNNVITEDEVSGLELAKVNSTTELETPKKVNLAITRKLIVYAIATVIMMIATTITLTIITINMETVVPKKIWGGKVSLNSTEPLHHPTPYVVISHTAGKFCTSFPQCSPIIQNIQGQHMTKHPDIGYNFVIGGDGNVYLGRGWDIQNFRSNNSIAISFIGNFIYDTLTQKMITALEALLKTGVKLEKLAPDYKLVAENQTQPTLSPGENVFKEIKKLPHYYPKNFITNLYNINNKN